MHYHALAHDANFGAMRVFLVLLAGLVWSALAPLAVAQTPSAGLDSYARGRAILDAGVAAHGGRVALEDARIVRRQLYDTWVDPNQGARPWRGAPQLADPAANAGFDRSEAESVIDYANGRLWETIRYADSPSEYAVVTDAVTRADGFQTIRYVSEPPYYRRYDQDSRASLLNTRFRRHPEGLLRMALARAETLGWVGETADGEDVISFADPRGVRVFLYFNARSHLLVKSETLNDHPIAGDAASTTTYSDYRAVGALQLPFRYVDRVAGLPRRYLDVRTVEFNRPAPDAAFIPPPTYVAVIPDPDELTVERVGDGLYMIRGSYNVMFAVFRDYVLVIEAPASAAYAEECLRLIRATAPDKPIWLVVTHFHADHIAGVRAFIAAGIPILTTADARWAIEQAVSNPHTIRPDALSARPRAPDIRVVPEREVFDDGTQRVEIYDFGPAPHIAQILVAYFPRAEILHVADLMDVLTPDLVIAGVDGAVMMRRIAERRLRVSRLVPMHGVPITNEDLERAMQVRARYVN